MILLVYPGLREASPEIPFGLLYIGSQLRKYGYSYDLLDLHANRYSWSEIETCILKKNYKYIGISGLATTYEFLKKFTRLVKSISNEIKIISGGLLSTPIPEFILRKTDVDIVVVGEGEITFVELMEALEKNLDLKNVKGICYKYMESIITTSEREPIKDLDTLPYPDYEAIDMNFYTRPIINNKLLPDLTKKIEAEKIKGITILFGRGCFGRCIFCYKTSKRIRKHSPAYVIDHIKYIYDKYNVRVFNCNDELGVSNKKWLRTFCDLLRKNNLKISYYISARADSLDDETILLLKESGCFRVSVGFESGSQKILDILKKNEKVEDYHKAVERCKKYKLALTGSTIVGTPGETVDTLRETRNFIKKVKLLAGPFYITAYPGTQLWNYAIETGLIKDVEKYLLMIQNKEASDFTINYTELNDKLLIRWHDYIIGTSQLHQWRIKDWKNFIKGIIKICYYKLLLRDF